MSELSALKEFLKHRISPKSTETNVTSLDGNMGGRWLISNSDYPQFLELYYKSLNHNLKLVEKKRHHDEYFRMFADIDISCEEIKKVFNAFLPKKMMNDIVQAYKNAISEIFLLPNADNGSPIISCRLKQSTKCHLQWPNIVVNNTYGSLIRDRVIDDLKIKYPMGDWNKWIDSASYTMTGLRMLGSLKKHERHYNRYFIVSGFDESNIEIGIKSSISLEDIKQTSIRVLDENPKLQQLTEIGLTLYEKANTMKPKSVCIIPKKTIKVSDSIKTQALDIPSLTSFQESVIQEGFSRSWTTAHYSEDLIKSFVLGPIKAVGDQYYTMNNNIKMICPIKGDLHKRECGCNYHVMGPDGTYIKCYDELCHGKHYPTTPIPLPADIKQFLYVNNNITINNNNGVINNTAQDLSSFVELNFIGDLNYVKVFNNEEKDRILLKALNGGESSMAFLLHACFSDKLHFSKGEKTGYWWFWNGIKWAHESGDITNLLYSEIGDKLLKKVRDIYENGQFPVASSLVKYAKRNVNEMVNTDKFRDAKILQIDTLIKKLETKEYKNKILSEAEWVFLQHNKTEISNLLDANPYLIGFPNGVYDLKEMKFRSAKHSDYVSIILGYEYNDVVDEDSKLELNNFIESIMPNGDDRHYLLKLLSTGLVGANSDELFHIFTGSGRNGKSKLAELLQATLGDYYESISSSFLTAKITAPNQATPHLVPLRKKRLIIGSEPDHHYKLNATLIKSLSGNDEIVSRQLYIEQSNFRPYFKIILLCNNIPEIDTSDKAVWLRCRCLSFPNSFVENPTLPHERKLDKDVSKKIPNWRLAFFHLLVNKLQDYHKEGLNPTPNMLLRTKEYQVESDMYLQWMNNRTEPSDQNIHTCTLYDDFRGWYSLHFNSKPPIAAHFSRGIAQYITMKKSVWLNGSNKQGVEKLKLKNIDNQS